MRLVSTSMTDAWLAEDKTGDQRPVVRATISRFRLKRFPYDLMWAEGGSDMQWDSQWQRHGVYTSALFGGDMAVREIRNIKSYTWSRSVDQDVATCRLTLLNSEVTPIGNADRVESESDFDMPGYFVYNRGADASVERWGFVDSYWEDYFIPDRLVKTYEGYGVDMDVSPGLDSNLMPSGTWLIDTVTYGSDGTIELEMRDIGKLLVDQIVFPPVIPYAEYPLSWEFLHSEMVNGREATGGTWSGKILDEGTARSSNGRYPVETVNDPNTNSPYVEAGEKVLGHVPKDAVRQLPDDANPDRPSPYWLSTGQEHRSDKVWWEFDFDHPRSVGALRLKVVGGPYRVYVSVMDSNGDWKGKKKIPYTVSTKDVDLNAGQPFIRNVIAERRRRTFDVVFKHIYHDIKRVRLTFTRLWDNETSLNYPWRAGLRHIQIYRNTEGDANGSNMAIGKGQHEEVVGNYIDYTDIVKTVCCWGGFFWPGHGHESGGGQVREDYVKLGWEGPADDRINVKRYVTWDAYDKRLPRGRCWGDFMNTGTHGVADLTVDLFDKQPLMDIISYIRDMIGFVFFVDELGGVIWRMPNNIKQGNYLSPVALGAHTRRRTKDYITIDEEQTLLDFQVSVNGEANREVIFVANLTGNHGVAIEGYAPSDAHMRRTAGWTDSKFESQQETRVMADMIATQMMFAYRTSRATIPGYPAIQIDDQVRFFERVTNDTYFHYVSGIEATLDMDSGEFTYVLTTHWLGEDEDNWALDTRKLASVTQSYMNQLGVEDNDNGVPAHTEDQS